jgi:hypothetical protein
MQVPDCAPWSHPLTVSQRSGAVDGRRTSTSKATIPALYFKVDRVVKGASNHTLGYCDTIKRPDGRRRVVMFLAPSIIGPSIRTGSPPRYDQRGGEEARWLPTRLSQLPSAGNHRVLPIECRETLGSFFAILAPERATRLCSPRAAASPPFTTARICNCPWWWRGPLVVRCGACDQRAIQFQRRGRCA